MISQGPLVAFSDALEALVQQTMPGVVGVAVGRGHGTGLVIAPDGYVLTNHHVVGAARRPWVTFAEGPVRAERLGADPATDLAVLRVEGAALVPLSLEAQRPLAVGQLVVAIGNPFRFERSVSVGIVSALDRSLPAPDGSLFEGLVQTDAAINPGNSGGPLVNARGEVVGINTAVVPWAQGIGFAIPARTASWVAAALMQKGRVERRYLGIGARAERLSAALVAEVGQARAVRVLEVGAQTPAERGGLREGDLVLRLNGFEVGSVDDVHRVLVNDPGKEARIEVLRAHRRRALTVEPAAERRAA